MARKLARPERLVVVGEGRLEPEGAGGGVDLVVDQVEFTARERLALVVEHLDG